MKDKGTWLSSLLMPLLLPAMIGLGQESTSGLGFGSVRGSVRDETGLPLPSIKVRAISRKTDQLAGEVRTDESGAYEFPKLAAGRYTLAFYSPEHQTGTLAVVEVRRDQATQAKEWVMIRAKPFAVIAGSTFNQAGFTLPGARVILERVPFDSEPIRSLKMEQFSNAMGEFAFRVVAEKGRYSVTTSAPGYETDTSFIEINGAERRNMAVRLQPKRK